MKKSFITLAILIAIFPYLGFPQLWKDFFITIAAVLIIILVVIPRREPSSRERTKETWFSENVPPPQAKEDVKEETQVHSPHEEDPK